jgi:hypothetical protein
VPTKGNTLVLLERFPFNMRFFVRFHRLVRPRTALEVGGRRRENGGRGRIESVEAEEGEEMLETAVSVGRKNEGGGVEFGDSVGVFVLCLTVATSVHGGKGGGGGGVKGEGERSDCV